MIKFTDSQKLACDISRNIAVTAGAGSGKTRVLVERYLWCLENNNYQVHRIVAVTFTEKAAGEMLGRIRKRVIHRISSEIGNIQRWEEVLEKMPLANISTIHGFCQRLLREFPIEAGVDPNFEVYDEALKHIRLIHLVDEFIQQRAASNDHNIRLLSELWTSPLTLRNILLHLIKTREKSVAWAEQICQENFPNYLNRIYTLVDESHRKGLRHIEFNQEWQEAVELIRSLIPDNDSGKLTNRCKSILEYDSEFRQQTKLDNKFTTLGMIRKNCSLIGVTKKWREDGRNVRLKEAFGCLKSLYARYLPPYEVHEALEQSGFQIQQALARLFLSVYELFRQDKAARHILDFDDLQERVLLLLENSEVNTLLSRRYDYIMVDEFQDTNQLQWNIIKKFGTTENGMARNTFCVVGDEKQSIYMFRGAEVSVFGQVREELQQANVQHDLLAVPPTIPEFGDLPQWQDNQHTGELIMAENFRSINPLVFFFNYLFSRIFLPSFDVERPYDVQHQELITGQQEAQESQSSLKLRDSDDFHPVEFLLVDHTKASDERPSTIEEPEFIALRIREMVQDHQISDEESEARPGRRFKDIAILLRTRTRLKEFEDALRQYGIPFIVAGGIGFYQQQEIYDLANLLRILVDSRQDIALAGVLRSSIFSFSDDQLLYVASGTRTEKSSDSEEMMRQTLWDMLQHHAHAVEVGAESIPEELDPPKFLSTFRTLSAWKSLADRIPITHLLRQILDDTGLYGILSADRRNVQAVTNIEKLLDFARTFEGEGFQSLSDFVAYLDQLIEIEEREGEAQIHAEGMDVVQLMTIHAAKGLEFPVVFVSELERPFNYGVSESMYIDAASPMNFTDIAVGIKGLDPEQNFASDDTILRKYLRHLNEEKTDAEMKRLLYVACTRAKEQLILSGAFSQKLSKSSWLTWLLDIFPLQDSLAQKNITISAESSDRCESMELLIPIRTDASFTPPCPPSRGELKQESREELKQKIPSSKDFPFEKGLPHSPLDGNTLDLRSGLKKIPPNPPLRKGGKDRVSPFSKGGLGGILTNDHDPSQLNSTALPLEGGQGGGNDLNTSQLGNILQENLCPIRDEKNEIFTVSPSTLHILFQCPRRYYYQQVLRLDNSFLRQVFIAPGEDPPTFDEAHEQQEFGARRGTIIHKIFEEQIFDQNWNEQERFTAIACLPDVVKITPQERQIMHLEAAIQKAYKNYMSSGMKELLANSPEVHREYHFQLKIGQVYISGILDVLFFDPAENTWRILDYKSNEIEDHQIEEEIRKHGYDIQMQIYALAVSRLLHTEQVKCILFFTAPGCRYEEFDLSSDTLKDLETRLVNCISQLSEGSIEFTQQKIVCAQCEYQLYKICPFS